MLISLDWLKEILPQLGRTKAEHIAERLTAAGLEVDAITRQADAYKGVVVAEVRAIKPHPGADRLRLVTVFDGTTDHEVVCGAPNVEEGQRVALAQLGAALPCGLTIERRTVRGVESCGMICSEEELGLKEKSDGIMVLSARARPGRAIAPVIRKTDVVLELGVTPNRPDALCHLGVARELAALYGFPLPKPRVRVKTKGEPASTRAKVEIKRGQRCARYLGRVIEGVTVGPSPDWVRHRLEAVGIRSISNVVDATNLALMELGHPLHAFDLDLLASSKVVVRTAKEGETLTTLDGVERQLHAEDLVIADGKAPIALAGVMGGGNSEVSADTTRILLECADFESTGIRRTAKRHGMHTEASHRFERGIDSGGLDRAIDRCAQLILELGGGTLLPGTVEAIKKEAQSHVVGIRPERATALLGRDVNRAEITKALTALGLKKSAAPAKAERLPRGHKKKVTKKAPKTAIFFLVPSWRVDLTREEDLIEEVARISGYDTIPTLMPPLPTDPWSESRVGAPERRLRSALVAEGFTEAISLAFSAERHTEALGLNVASAVRLKNPLGEETALMRMSLLPALLRSAALNEAHQRTTLRLFEIGRTFAWSAASELPDEALCTALLMRGRRYPEVWAHNDKLLLDAFDLKGALEAMLAAFNIEEAEYRSCEGAPPWLHPRSATELWVNGESIGAFGELHPNVMQTFGLEGPPLYVAEIDVAGVTGVASPPRKFRSLPRYPAVTRDLSFFVGRTVSAQKILETVHSALAEHGLEKAEIFDVYEGKNLPKGQRSIAITMRFRAKDRTLTDNEVDAAQAAVMGALEKTLEASIRKG